MCANHVEVMELGKHGENKRDVFRLLEPGGYDLRENIIFTVLQRPTYTNTVHLYSYHPYLRIFNRIGFDGGIRPR